jgi:hypothetical protein
MEPDKLRFGGGVAATLLHPVVGVALAIAIGLIFFLPRKYVVVPLLMAIFLIPRGQVVVLANLHFTIARLLILATLARFAASGLGSGWSGGFNAVDKAFTLAAVSYLAIFSLQWMEVQAFIKSLGDFLDAMGGYCVLRFLVRDYEDIVRVIKTLAIVAIVMAPLMLNEQITHQNVFGLLGGVADGSAIRDGKIRSQAAFAVYITAGVFGASLVPLLVWLWSAESRKIFAALGLISATVVTMTSRSSTPVLAYTAGIVALCLWPVRENMRALRWTIVIVLTGLHLVMKAPVWALIARIDLTGSSSGYHRFELVNNCIIHFADWWLLGYKAYDEWGFDMWDLSNQYVAYAVTGGLLTLILFIAVISLSFSRLGGARKLIRGDRKHEWFLWCLCAALVAHVVAYFGIGYFDQMQFAWYALLAIICAAIAEVSNSLSRMPEPSEVADEGEDYPGLVAGMS